MALQHLLQPAGAAEPSRENASGSERNTAPADRAGQLAQLREALRTRQAEWREAEREDRCPTGRSGADALLDGGFRRGEVSALEGRPGAGLTTLMAGAVAEATGEGRLCAWVDPAGSLCAAGLAAHRVVLDRLLWVRPPEVQVGWAAQVLARCGAFALVAADLSSGRLALPALHRLMDAARAGRCAVVLLVPENCGLSVPFRASLRADVAEAGEPVPGRSVRMEVLASLRGPGRSARVDLSPPPAGPPPEGWAPPSFQPFPAAPRPGFGSLVVEPIVPRLFSHGTRRRREPSGSLLQHDPGGAGEGGSP